MPSPKTGPGVTLAIGIAATLVLGVLGTGAWLGWVWLGTPRVVRARISTTKRSAIVVLASLSVAAFVVGIALTCAALTHAFDAVARVPAADRSRLVAQGIASAMNWTLAGIVPMLLAVVVLLVAGYRLRRAHAGSAPPRG